MDKRRARAERRLIREFLAGRREAFARVDHWIAEVLRAGYAGLRHEHEDLRQVVHLKLLVQLEKGRFRSQSTLRSYVNGITHHTAIDRLRRRRPESPWIEAGVPQPGTGGHGVHALRPADARILIRELFRKLPETCRRLWRMVFFDRLHYAEIAERLGIPSGTVKSRMWHCRRLAQALLQNSMKGSPPADAG